MGTIKFTAPVLFLSTLSLRRATISCAWSASKLGDFYPRSPYGERPVMDNIIFVPGKFLSTLSLRRATIVKGFCSSGIKISIHALLTESDHQANLLQNQHRKFLSTLSLRRATSSTPAVRSQLMYFYPRSPYGERLTFDKSKKSKMIFLSTLSLRRATIISKPLR